MKANRKFVEADEAVSPVIAVILMVAITVVLAATVFVLVSDIGNNSSKSGPQIGWTDSETGDSWQVSQAPNQVYWEDFSIRGPAGANFTISFQCASPCTGSFDGTIGDDLSDVDGDASATTKNPVKGGDSITFCGGTGEYVITHEPTNTVNHRFTFADVADCA